MSRIGKEPITIPSGVTVDVANGMVTVKGPKGELQQALVPGITITQEDNTLVFTRKSEDKLDKSFHGLMRTLVQNMVTGVTEGFSKVLEIHGVGYRASMAGNTLKLGVGFSHDVNFPVPEGIQMSVEGNTITISGIDKQLVGQTAALIREVRKPEPYKGKGIRYKDEYIIRKAGKTASA